MPKNRAKHNWTEITAQYIASDLEDFGAFLRSMGYHPSIARCREVAEIREKKRRVISEIRDRIEKAVAARPMLEREEKRQRVLKDLENTALSLRSAVTARLYADQVAVKMRPDETQETWSARINTQMNRGTILTSNEIIALAGAVKVSDDLIRKATGLEDFNWESEAQRAQLENKAHRLEVDIIKTSTARPLEDVVKQIEDHRKKQA